MFLRMESWIEHISVKITFLREQEQHKLHLFLKTKLLAQCYVSRKKEWTQDTQVYELV